MSITYKGSISVQYSYFQRSAYYGDGNIVKEDGMQPVKIFEIDPGGFNKSNREHGRLMEIMYKCTQIPSKSLLVPLILDRYLLPDGTLRNNIIRIFYIFDCLFLERTVRPLFPSDNNGLIDVNWGQQTIDLLNAVSAMHQIFLYHGDLANPSKYAYLNESICIIMPNVLCKSEDKALANDDLLALGSFLGGLAQPSMEWTNFLDGFGKYHIDVLKKHPVLKRFKERYEYLRAMLTRVNSAWDSGYKDWMVFRNYLGHADEICPNWVSQIIEKDYVAVYRAENNIVVYGANVNLLLYVQNAMKHANARRRTTESIDQDLHRMFPGLSTKVHSLFCHFSLQFSTIKVFPNFP